MLRIGRKLSEEWDVGLVSKLISIFVSDISHTSPFLYFFKISDFKNDYKSLYPYFMESIWWVFQQLYNKGLVYQGVKVMPYSTACTTALSNFESGQNYKEVVDPAVVVR